MSKNSQQEQEFFSDVKIITGLATKELDATQVLNKTVASKIERFIRSLRGGARTLGHEHLNWTLTTAQDLLQYFKSGKYVSYDKEITMLYKDLFAFLGKFPADVSLNFNEIISRFDETKKKLD